MPARVRKENLAGLSCNVGPEGRGLKPLNEAVTLSEGGPIFGQSMLAAFTHGVDLRKPTSNHRRCQMAAAVPAPWAAWHPSGNRYKNQYSSAC
jgi:hypothetical protein